MLTAPSRQRNHRHVVSPIFATSVRRLNPQRAPRLYFFPQDDHSTLLEPPACTQTRAKAPAKSPCPVARSVQKHQTNARRTGAQCGSHHCAATHLPAARLVQNILHQKFIDHTPYPHKTHFRDTPAARAAASKPHAHRGLCKKQVQARQPHHGSRPDGVKHRGQLVATRQTVSANALHHPLRRQPPKLCTVFFLQ